MSSYFFARENVNPHQVDLGMTMLASLGGGHLHHTARTTLDDDVATFTKGRALHGKGQGGISIGLLSKVSISSSMVDSINDGCFVEGEKSGEMFVTNKQVGQRDRDPEKFIPSQSQGVASEEVHRSTA